MKHFVFLIAAACIFPAPLSAQDQDTRAALAISYLKRVAKGELDIAKHTALSPNCSIARRKIIRERLKLLQSSYLRKDDNYSLEAIKADGQFAAALIRAEHPSTPLTSRIFAIALLHKKDGWKASPLPGSFANTGYGYDEKVEKTIKSLEHWMAAEKIKRETAHRTQAATEFQAALAKIENEMQLDKFSAQESVRNLIEQCRSKSLMRVLASMGAASGALTESLENTISTVSRGLAIDEQENDWQCVTSRASVYAIMNIDDKRSEIAVGFYNPMLRKQSKVLYFPFEKKDGKTFARLSPMLTVALLPENERWQLRWRNRREDERNLLLKIPATILSKIEPKTVESPEKLLATFLSKIKSDQFQGAIELLPGKGHHFEKEKEQAAMLTNLATLWKGLAKVKSSPRPQFEIIKEGSLALAPLQYALPNKPGRFQTWNLWMLRSKDGWQLVPENTIKSIQNDKLLLSMKALEKRLASMTLNQRKEISRKMLSQVSKIKPENLKQAVSEKEAIALFKKFRGHLRSDDNQAALSCCAVLIGTDDSRTLKNFNYALRGVDDHIKDDRILGVITSGVWSGISARTQSRLAGTHDYPVYLCLHTAKGPKILLDIDLRHASNKGRKLINTSNWDKLKKNVPAKAFKQIQTIFTQHEKLVAQDKEAEKKLHE